MRNMRWRHGWRCLIIAGSILAGSAVLAALPLARVQDLAGVWDLSISDTNSKCRIALPEGQSNAGRQQITVPFACVKVLPVLTPVDAWALTGDGHLDLFDSIGQTVLDFTAADAAAFIASGAQSEVYQLASLQGAPQKNNLVVNQGGAGTAPAVVATKQDVPAAAADMVGRYSILRDGGKDTGCMLTLDKQAKAPGGQKASLAPGCRDQGIVIFDPVGWQIANGRLVLTARKGHKTHLDAQPDGTWKKDPKEGKSLTLKKM